MIKNTTHNLQQLFFHLHEYKTSWIKNTRAGAKKNKMSLRNLQWQKGVTGQNRLGITEVSCHWLRVWPSSMSKWRWNLKHLQICPKLVPEAKTETPGTRDVGTRTRRQRRFWRTTWSKMNFSSLSKMRGKTLETVEWNLYCSSKIKQNNRFHSTTFITTIIIISSSRQV